jgi:Family of unknown function (DUF6299)
MRVRRVLTAAVFGMTAVPFTAGAASAAPPSNDESPGAVVLHLGDQVNQDTTQATTNAGDDTLNESCGAPATNASVWYRYTPAKNRNVVLDTTASDYSAGMMVFKGTPSADSLITCGPGEVGIRARAGQTYYVMAFSDTDTIGGNLVLSLKNAPTPHVHVTIAKHGLAFHGGAAQIHGTYRCTHGESFAGVDSHLFQRAGRLKIQADAGTTITCDGTTHPWSTRLVSPVGTYAKGRARAKALIFACGVIQCSHIRVKRHVHLSWAKSLSRAWMKQPTSSLEAHHPVISRQQHWPR